MNGFISLFYLTFFQGIFIMVYKNIQNIIKYQGLTMDLVQVRKDI